MDQWFWLQIVGAVFAGNLVSGVFFYAFILVWREDRKGETDWAKLPMKVLLAWLVPLVFLLAVNLSLQ